MARRKDGESSGCDGCAVLEWCKQVVCRRETVEWAKTLPDEWTWYVTLTFRRETTSDAAVSKLKSWLRRHPTNSGLAIPTGVLWSVEPHKLAGVHIHALMAYSHSVYAGHCKTCAHSRSFKCDRSSIPHGAHPDAPPWRQLNESWFCHHGIARFYAYDAALGSGAMWYITKYLFKTEPLDWGYWNKVDWE